MFSAKHFFDTWSSSFSTFKFCLHHTFYSEIRCNARAFKVKHLPSPPTVLQHASRGWLAGALDLIPDPILSILGQYWLLVWNNNRSAVPDRIRDQCRKTYLTCSDPRSLSRNTTFSDTVSAYRCACIHRDQGSVQDGSDLAMLCCHILYMSRFYSLKSIKSNEDYAYIII